MSKAYQLMGMYANRANATWAESQQWTSPSVLPATEQEQFCASDAWLPYKLNAVKLLRSGGIVVHIDACEDSVMLADGSSVDLWTSDPWVLAQQLRPGSVSNGTVVTLRVACRQGRPETRTGHGSMAAPRVTVPEAHRV